MDRLQQVYGRAPVWAQNAMCSVEGLRIRARRFPPRFWKLLEEVQARGSWTAEQRRSARLARLRAMLVHAGRHVPYWRELFAEVGFAPARLQHEADLEVLPLLTKDMVIAQGERMHAEHVPAGVGGSVTSKTSGTTGAGMVFVMSEAALHHQWAVCWRFRRWHGIERDVWCAQLGGRTVVPLAQRGAPYHRINAAGRQLLLSGYHLSPETATAYLDEIARRRIPWVHGYPSLVVLLADAARGRSWPDLRWVSLASETVTAAQRQRIEEGFGVRPVEHYAQTEAVANASETLDGELRFDDDFSHVELLADEEAAGRRIVGTSLDNWHMPFIRYDTGDLATMAAEQDDRGPGRRIAEIDGRREDYVVLADGAMVGRTDHIFKELTFVREAQIRQSTPGRITIALVPREPWSDRAEHRLRAEVAERLGPIEVAVEVAERLPRGPGGKLRLVVREGSD